MLQLRRKVARDNAVLIRQCPFCCLQQVVQECRDHRASLMSEMVRGIRTVKLQVWEPVWQSRLSAARNEEMKASSQKR